MPHEQEIQALRERVLRCEREARFTRWLYAATVTAAVLIAWGDDIVAAVADAVEIATNNAGGTPTARMQFESGATPTPIHVMNAHMQFDPFGVGAGETGNLRFLELAANGNDYTGFKAPDAIGLGANAVYTLPTGYPGSTAFLKSGSTGTMSWDTSVYLTGNETITLSGDATGSGATSIAVTLANSGVTAGSYGSASQVGTFTVDSKGRLTAAGSTSIAVNASAVTSGTLGVARGGTGQSGNLTAGGVIYGASTTAMGSSAAGTSGSGVLISGGAGTPTWGNATSGNLTTQWGATTTSTTVGSSAISGTQNQSTANGTGWGSISSAFAGVYGTSGSGTTQYNAGVLGWQTGTGANSGGVVGAYSSSVWGGLGYSDGASTRWAGYFNGNANVTGSASIGSTLDTGGRITYGSVEYLEDGGANLTTFQSSLQPSTDNARDLGASGQRWNELFLGDTITMGSSSTRFGVQRVSLTADGTLFTHPGASLTLTWVGSTRVLTFNNGTASTYDCTLETHDQDTLSSSTAYFFSDDVAGGAGRSMDGDVEGSYFGHAWYVVATSEGSAGPGFMFTGTGWGTDIQGLVIFWY